MDRSLKIIVQGGRAVTGGNRREGAGAAQGGVSHAPGHHQADEELIGIISATPVTIGSQHGCFTDFQPADVMSEDGPAILPVAPTAEVRPQFDVALSKRFGFVHTLDQAERLRRDYELQTNTSYVAVNNIRLSFGHTELSRENHRIFWEKDKSAQGTASTIEFDGVPFILLAKRVLDCQHGRDWHKRSKEKEKVERKRRKKTHPAQETRKLGCLANITMREVVCFPEYKIDDNSEHKRKYASRQLRAALREGEVEGQKRIYVDLPEVSQHNHPIDQDADIMHQTLDKRVSKELQEIVSGGVVEVEDVRQRLREYVKNHMFFGRQAPPVTNRRFFPNKASLRTHIRRCCSPRQTPKKKNTQAEAELAQATKIGQSFCEFYYKTFDANRQQLECLYHKEFSVMSFEGDRKCGSSEIVAKLVSLPFKTVKHVVTSLDIHLTVDQSILITVLGQLQVDQDPKNTFHQTFLLKNDNQNFFIVNDIFRLGIHDF